MVSLDQIRERMREHYEEDSERSFQDVSGATLEEALENAAIQLGISKKRLDYEILEKGASGFFTLNPREWKIRAYELNRKYTRQKNIESADEAQAEIEEKAMQADGMAYVHCSPMGAFLKVTAPVGAGRVVTIDDVLEKIRDRGVTPPSDTMIKTIIDNATGEYIRIGEFARIPGNDAMMTIDINDSEMKAYLYVTPPAPGGADVSADMIVSFLKTHKVVHGLNMDRIQAFQDMPIYRENYLVAEGTAPKNGEDATILYNFETDNTRVRLKESRSGQINFKELNLIQNVVEGQPLAQKIEAKRGIAGKTVTGKYLEANSGKDVALPVGKNTKIAEDGATIVAEINGQVLLVKGKINVEPIYTVEGNVSVKTGNIMFLGTVLVNGNVEDGYEIKASGNIEVRGTVGKAILDAEGDILINQGIVGREEAEIRAGKSIWSKFIQNTKIVEAGDMVIVSDGILNSQVIANKKVICRGKRADIIASQVSSSEAIFARNLGSPSGGNDTVLSVGFDPRSKERFAFLQLKVESNQRELSDIKLNLTSLEKIKESGRDLPKEKEELLTKLSETRYILETEIQEAQAEINQIQEYLLSLRVDGRISASGMVYSGVRIIIRDIVEDVRKDYKATTFYLDNSLIRYGKYRDEKDDEDFKKVPSGYSAY